MLSQGASDVHALRFRHANPGLVTFRTRGALGRVGAHDTGMQSAFLVHNKGDGCLGECSGQGVLDDVVNDADIHKVVHILVRINVALAIQLLHQRVDERTEAGGFR